MKTSEEIKKEVREDIRNGLKGSGCFTSEMVDKVIEAFDKCSTGYVFGYDNQTYPCGKIVKVL